MGKFPALALILMLGTFGCAATPDAEPEPEPAEDMVEDSDSSSGGGRRLDEAIEVGDDVYMVPAGAPHEDGCQPYHLYSPVKRVDQSIYYRTEDGRFVRSRAEADCRAE